MKLDALLRELSQTSHNVQKQLESVANEKELEAVRLQILGKKGKLQEYFSQLSSLKGPERAQLGSALNELKKNSEAACQENKLRILRTETQKLPYIDITQPGLGGQVGHLHPISIVMNDVYQIFTELGFAIVDGIEVESDWYNFEVLNMPPEHPARDMQDTFYLRDTYQGSPLVPRTHTSSAQVRFMETHEPPYKIIVPGKAYRNENEDSTHSWSFYQVEGLAVGQGVTMSDLKGTLLHVVRGMLGQDTDIRFRPSYFPYTEPSVEIDAKYKGKWLELGGAGMVHPSVLERGGVDPQKYTGFAFGWGAERIAVIKYNLSDLRQLWRPNLNFLEQF